MTTPIPLPPTPPAYIPQKTNTLAIVGFVLAFFFAFVGSILCIVALTQISNGGDVEKGRGLAIAGIIIGVVPVIVICVLALLGPVIGSVFSNIVTTI
jgi:uncharacterized membrane protein